MSLLIKYLLTSKYQNRLANHRVSGFTMVELLVATIMSFLIITPILAFAVNILNDDVKEQAKASTELELQSAMDYIQQDISQAYYIYDGAGVNTIKGQLYYGSDTTNTKIPVLVFWKRELVRNAINVTTQSPLPCPTPATDDASTTPICDDTYVDSLVAYYLVKDNNPKWCQPGSGSCPARIERWSIKDGVKNGSGVYVCGTTAGQEGQDTTLCPDTNGDNRQYFRRDKGFRPYNYKSPTSTSPNSYPLTWENSTYVTTGTYITPVPQVLVNYISPRSLTITPTTFCINTLNIPASPSPTEANYRIGVDPGDATKFTGFAGCVNNAGNIAQINIRGDALRRNEPNNVDCTKQPNYCPIITGQIGGRSELSK